MALPKMIRVKQHFEAPVVQDLPGAIRTELDRIDAPSIVGRGDSVAVAAGSRGVANTLIVDTKAVGGQQSALCLLARHVHPSVSVQQEKGRNLQHDMLDTPPLNHEA